MTVMKTDPTYARIVSAKYGAKISIVHVTAKYIYSNSFNRFILAYLEKEIDILTFGSGLFCRCRS